MAMAAWQEGTLGSRQSVDTVLDTVLAKNPMHPGAHHYRIHLWDGTNAARALPSAGLYAKAAPGIAHAWHMPGHTYTELKRYAEAAFQQEGSARVDHAAMNATRVMPFEIHNYAHNNQWLVTSLLHVGRVREALAVAWNLVEQPRDPQKNGPNDGGSAQRSGRARLADAYLRYELWEPLLEAAAAGDLDWADNAIEKKERAYTLGVAHYATGDRAKLTEQILELKKLREAETKPAPPPTSPTPAPPPQSDTKSAVALTGPPPPDRAAPPVAGASPAEQPELAELEGYEKLLDRAFAAAFDRFSKASRMRPESLARAHLAARNFGLAEAEAKRAVEKAPNQFPAMACLVEVLAACDRTSDAQQAFATLAPLLDSADPDTPVVKRLAKLAASWKLSGWDKPSPVISSSASTPREDLSALGPLTWSPFPAADFALQDTKGNAWRLEAHRGRSVLLLFFLGGKCAHCLQQLQEFGKQFEALKTIGVDVVAVSTDALEASKDLKNNSDGIKFPMPILSDSGLDTFKQYRSFDDFENQPLHGTFLIDRTGQIRFQRISADPFLDVDFIKTEAARVERNLGRASKTSNRELTSRASGTSSAGR
jgi:peroxiredoxin